MFDNDVPEDAAEVWLKENLARFSYSSLQSRIVALFLPIRITSLKILFNRSKNTQTICGCSRKNQ